MNKYPSAHITTSATTTVVSRSAYLLGLAVVVRNAGTTWTVDIRSKETPAKSIYVQDGAAVVIGAKYFNFPDPFLMREGIDIVTAGGAPGVLDVHFSCREHEH